MILLLDGHHYKYQNKNYNDWRLGEHKTEKYKTHPSRKKLPHNYQIAYTDHKTKDDCATSDKANWCYD